MESALRLAVAVCVSYGCKDEPFRVTLAMARGECEKRGVRCT